MSETDGFRRRADDLLADAARAENMNERGRLIDEALRWRMLALGADNHAWEPHDLDDFDEPSG